MFFTLYVDDILLVGNNLQVNKANKRCLSSIIEMEDMGEANNIIGVEIVINHLEKLLGRAVKWVRSGRVRVRVEVKRVENPLT